MHHPPPPPGHLRYQDLTTYIFRSKRLGTWTLLPFQMAVLVGMALTYTVVGAEDLKQLVGILSPDTHLSLWTYLVAFGAVEVLLSMVRAGEETAPPQQRFGICFCCKLSLRVVYAATSPEQLTPLLPPLCPPPHPMLPQPPPFPLSPAALLQ